MLEALIKNESIMIFIFDLGNSGFSYQNRTFYIGQI